MVIMNKITTYGKEELLLPHNFIWSKSTISLIEQIYGLMLSYVKTCKLEQKIDPAAMNYRYY